MRSGITVETRGSATQVSISGDVSRMYFVSFRPLLRPVDVQAGNTQTRKRGFNPTITATIGFAKAATIAAIVSVLIILLLFCHFGCYFSSDFGYILQIVLLPAKLFLLFPIATTTSTTTSTVTITTTTMITITIIRTITISAALVVSGSAGARKKCTPGRPLRMWPAWHEPNSGARNTAYTTHRVFQGRANANAKASMPKP